MLFKILFYIRYYRKKVKFLLQRLFKKKYVVYHLFPFNTLKVTLKDEDVHELYQICEILDKHGIHYRLTDGLALGLYREHHFIRHDNDFDFDLMDFDALDVLKEEMLQRGYKVGREAYFLEKLQQIVFYNKDSLIVDFSIWFREDGVLKHYGEEHFVRIQELKYFETLTDYECYGYTFKLPGHMEDWLVKRFGEDWRVPKTYKGDWKQECKDIHRFFTWLIVGIVLSTYQVSYAQEIGWEVNARGFFNNLEGKKSSYRQANTYAGFRIQPQVSLGVKENTHQLVAGYDALIDWGGENYLDKEGFLAYYKYQNQYLRVLLGKYPRRMMVEEMPEYLICDSIQIYRPNMTGFDFLYKTKSGYIEAFLDWTSKRGADSREQFMAGGMIQFNVGGFLLGANGYYYHYALEFGGESYKVHTMHDNTMIHPYVGRNFKLSATTDSLGVRVGTIINFDRDRGLEKQPQARMGFLGEAGLRWKKWGVNETFYWGAGLQRLGADGFGEYYWGDPFYRSPIYNRTDLSYLITFDRYATLKVGFIIHITDKGVQTSQLLTLIASLPGKK